MPPSAYRTLLSPGRIGALELRNRLVVTAMGANFAEEGGSPAIASSPITRRRLGGASGSSSRAPAA